MRSPNNETRDSPTLCDNSVSRLLTGMHDNILLLVTMISSIQAGIVLTNSTSDDIMEMVVQGILALNQASARNGRKSDISCDVIKAGKVG